MILEVKFLQLLLVGEKISFNQKKKVINFKIVVIKIPIVKKEFKKVLSLSLNILIILI